MFSASQPQQERGIRLHNSEPPDGAGQPQVPPRAILVEGEFHRHRLPACRVKTPARTTIGLGKPRRSDGATSAAAEGLAFHTPLPGTDPGFARRQDLHHIHVGAALDRGVMSQWWRKHRQIHCGHRRYPQDQLRIADPSEGRGRGCGNGHRAKTEPRSFRHAKTDLTCFLAAKVNDLVIGDGLDEDLAGGSRDRQGCSATIGTKGLGTICIPVFQPPWPWSGPLHQKKAI